MSVIDELKGLEDRVARRMKELRPLVDEYRELEQVAQRLGVSAAAPDTPSPRRRSTRRNRTAPGTTTAGGSSRRASGPPRRSTGIPPDADADAATDGASRTRTNGRRDQLLEMVRARPGITVREAGSELGVDPTSLYRIVHRLERDGALEKRGRELVPR